MGNRNLNTSFTPKLNVASDGSESRGRWSPAAPPPTSSTGPKRTGRCRSRPAARRRSPASGPARSATARRFAARSARKRPTRSSATPVCWCSSSSAASATRRPTAPRSAMRLIPVIQDLSLEAIDGTLLRRSIPALFSGLGRRPLGGDRWGTALGGHRESRTRPAAIPYTEFPPEPCLVAGCANRIAPEYSFTSSDPDIADFVRQDPNSTNLRKPYLDPKGKVVTDNTSGLLCPFNAGTTTVTVSAGGFSYSEAGDRPGRQRAAPLRHPPAAPGPLQTQRRQRHAAVAATATTSSAGQPARRASRRPRRRRPAHRRPRANAGPRRSHRRRSRPPRSCRSRQAAGARAGGRAAAPAADRAAAAAGRRAGADLPGRREARRGGGDRGVAGLLALRPGRRRPDPCRPTCSA